MDGAIARLFLAQELPRTWGSNNSDLSEVSRRSVKLSGLTVSLERLTYALSSPKERAAALFLHRIETHEPIAKRCTSHDKHQCPDGSDRPRDCRRGATTES